MSESFFRSSQAAKQLGISSYHVRRLCEVGEINAELTKGQQWRIPESELARLRREGIPDIPAEPEDGVDDSYDGPIGPDDAPEELLAAPSDDVIEAAEEVKIVESRLQKRRIEKQAEELEDWFRERQRREAAHEAAAHQRAEAERAQEFRRKWMDAWIQYALRSRPYDAPRETELEIHQAVQTVLANLQPDQPEEVIQRLVDAAVARALQPWKRLKAIRGAIDRALNGLPWDLNNRPEWAGLKQRAAEAAATAIGKLSADATSRDMEEIARLAVEPMAREYAHCQNCQNLCSWIFLSDGTFEDQQEARQAVIEALARLPVGTSQKELEKTKEAVLERYRTAIRQRKASAQQREEEARQEAEKARQLANVVSRVDWRLSRHLGDCIHELEQEEIEFEDASDRWELESALKKRIRPLLLSKVRNKPEMPDDDIDELIGELVSEHVGAFLEDE